MLVGGRRVALLDTIREVAAAVGLDEAGALPIYLPLLEQTVANARTLGIERALTGPATRGDAGTIAAHLAVLGADAPGALTSIGRCSPATSGSPNGVAPCHRMRAKRLRTALAPDP